jgi:cell filamentation protein, protein adenylyltransferase
MKTENRAGAFVQQQSGPEGFSAFIPAPLPPSPPIELDDALARLTESAAYALGKLGGVSSRIEPDRLLYMYVRKEAVLSSQIEGTQSTLPDLLEYESSGAPGTPVEDVGEVSRYVDALMHGASQIRSGTLPLSLRLIKDVHSRLMAEGRGSNQAPGEFRRSQTWIGGTRPGNATYVPPPAHEVMPALGNLERFLQDGYGRTPTLLKAGLAHAQFETIHPFLDGNGRMGRLLISLILVTEGALPQPFFYISLYFKRNRADYYAALQRVRTHGDWEGWLRFFLIGVEAVAEEATRTAEALQDLFDRDRAQVHALGRAAPSAIRVYEQLKRRIVISPTQVAGDLGITWPTAAAAISRLEDLGIAAEITGKKRDRLYRYSEQLRLLDEGVEGPRINRGRLPVR